jgi:hypothetical protein
VSIELQVLIGEHIEVKYCGSGADLAIEFASGLDAVKTKLNADTSDDGEVAALE